MLGIEDDEPDNKTPMTAKAQIWFIPKSPAARPSTGLNSSIGTWKNLMKSKLSSTKTPRKQGGLTFSTMAEAS